MDDVVVVGASVAGLLSALVLAQRSARVVLLERDEAAVAGQPRPGVPQAHHPHVLLARGLVRSVVASGFSPEELFEARVLAAHGLPRLAGAEVRWNLLERPGSEGDLGLVAAGFRD